MSELADKKRLTVLFITKDLGVISQLCNLVAVRYAGRIVESGSVEGIIATSRYPYTKALLDAVQTNDLLVPMNRPGFAGGWFV